MVLHGYNIVSRTWDLIAVGWTVTCFQQATDEKMRVIISVHPTRNILDQSIASFG